MEPKMEPMPPMTTTAKTTTTSEEPISGDTCTTGADSTPASAASAVPAPYVSVTITGTLIPNACTSLGFSVAARSVAPSDVRSITNHVVKQTTSDAAIT